MISRQERNYRSFMAAKQVEIILSPDNLCMDTFVRSYMDEAGYIPIALVLQYPNVAQFGALYGDLKYRLRQLGDTSHIEVDAINELVRTKDNWEMWLMPNHFGGKGQPRYVKQVRAGMQQMNMNGYYGGQQENMMYNGEENGMQYQQGEGEMGTADGEASLDINLEQEASNPDETTAADTAETTETAETVAATTTPAAAATTETSA